MRFLKAIILMLSASLAFGVAASPTAYTGSIQSDTMMYPGDVLRSYNNTFELVVKLDGSIALRRVASGVEYWNPGKFGNRLVFQWDGNFVLYQGNQPVWAQGTVVTPDVYRLYLADNGALIAGWPTPINKPSLWQFPPAPAEPTNPTNPGGGGCPGGGAPQLYPACAFPGTLSQYNTPIPACSPGEAARIAVAYGYAPGVCQ